MLTLPERIRAIESFAPQGGFAAGSELSGEMLDNILQVFQDPGFLDLPLLEQAALLDFIQAAYITTYDTSAPRMAEIIGPVFQAHLRSGRVPLARLCKTYDLLYFLYWCTATSIEQQRGFNNVAVVPFSRYLRPRARGAAPAAGVRREGPIRLCYLAQFAYDSGGNALGLVLETLLKSVRTHLADEYELYVYAWMYKDFGFLERLKALGVVVRIFDLSEYAERQLVGLRQSFFDDRIDVAITDMNSAIPHYLFERRVAPVQIFYQLGLPFWKLDNLDAVFLGWEIEAQRLGFDASRCFGVPAPRTTANISPVVDPERVQRERQRFPPSAKTIGFYGRLAKITPQHCELVGRLLERHPDTIAVFGGSGNAAPIRAFIRERGLEQRLFVIDEFVDGHVWGHLLDVFLDTFPLAGGYSCREVIAKGKPIVHMRSADMPNLNTFLDDELGATSGEEYVATVSRLLEDPRRYARARARAFEIARIQDDLQPFASTFHSAVQAALQLPRVPLDGVRAKPLTSEAPAANILA